MSKVKLLPCPFCRAKLKDNWQTVSEIQKDLWCLSHTCNFTKNVGTEIDVFINVYGTTKEEAVARWNKRANTNGA